MRPFVVGGLCDLLRGRGLRARWADFVLTPSAALLDVRRENEAWFCAAGERGVLPLSVQ